MSKRRYCARLKGDGSVVAWGCGTGADWGQCSVPSGLSGVAAISAGIFHSLALVGDGADLTVNPRDNPDPVEVGSQLTYSTFIGNNGPDRTSNVQPQEG